MNSRLEYKENNHLELSSNAFVCLVAAFPVLLAALLSAVIHASIPFSKIDADTEFASIISPAHNSSVQGNYTAAGSIKKTQRDRLLYIVEESEGNYYPKAVVANEPLSWSHNFYAGAPKGTKFRLAVISVDSIDNQRIIDWFKTGETNGRYPGISSLHSVEELTAVELVVK